MRDDEEAEGKKFVEGLGRELFKLKIAIEGNLTALENLVSGNLTIEQHKQTKSILEELEVNLDKYRETSETLVKNMDTADREAKLKESETYYKDNYLKYK